MGTSKREGDILASQITIQQLQERDQLLSAQNEILKVGNAFELLPFLHLLEEILLLLSLHKVPYESSLVPLLQMEKANLKKKVVELDDMVNALLGTQSTQQRIRPSSMTTKVCLNW